MNSIKSINDYVDSLYNQSNAGIQESSIQTHLSLMQDRATQIFEMINRFKTLEELETQPWMDKTLFLFIQKTMCAFLDESTQIGTDLEFLSTRPFDQATDVNKFSIYIYDVLNYIDNAYTDVGFKAWWNKITKRGPTTRMQAYTDLINKVAALESKPKPADNQVEFLTQSGRQEMA